MPRFSTEDGLTGNRQVVLILRLTLDQDAHLRHGELLDAGAAGQGRFATVTDLSETVERWLERQQDAGSRNGDR